MRSATQPLGSPQPLSRARLTSRLGEVNAGFQLLAGGAEQLSKGLTEGAAKLRAAIWLEEATGLPLTGKPAEGPPPRSDPAVTQAQLQSRGKALASGLKQASAVLQWSRGVPIGLEPAGAEERVRGHEPAVRASIEGQGCCRCEARAVLEDGRCEGRALDGRRVEVARSRPRARQAEGSRQAEGREPAGDLLRELTRAAEGASQIAEGAGRAHREVTEILNDPVGRRALDRLLIDEQTVHEHPELLKSFAAYITPDGHRRGST